MKEIFQKREIKRSAYLEVGDMRTTANCIQNLKNKIKKFNKLSIYIPPIEKSLVSL